MYLTINHKRLSLIAPQEAKNKLNLPALHHFSSTLFLFWKNMPSTHTDVVLLSRGEQKNQENSP
jgi:hypothetical protein